MDHSAGRTCQEGETYCITLVAAVRKDIYISHTSKMVSSSLESDVLTYETKNTVYRCPLKYMTVHPYGNVSEEYKEKLTHRDEYSEYALDRIIGATAKIATNTVNTEGFVAHITKLQEQGQKELKAMGEEEKYRLCEIARQYEDCAYIEVSNVEQGNKLAYHFGSHTGIVKPSVHSGMFQDSVLYMQ